MAERENNGGRGYPFCGIVGNETAKRAILLALTEPLLGGVLLAGERGTGKSTLIRGIPEIEEGKRLWELPLYATRDRLEGSDDWELLLAGGQRRHAPGILEEAAGQLLYVDEINLLPEETERELLDSQENFILFGTMDPEEGSLSPALTERFGLFVYLEGEKEIHKRIQVIRNCLEYQENPEKFRERYQGETRRLRWKLERAKRRLPEITVTDGAMELAAELVKEAACEGNRSELYLIWTSRAIAAWEQGNMVTASHLLEAAQYVFPHRGRQALSQYVTDRDTEQSQRPGQLPPEGKRQAGDSQKPADGIAPPGSAGNPEEQDAPGPSETGLDGTMEDSLDAEGGMDSFEPGKEEDACIDSSATPSAAGAGLSGGVAHAVPFGEVNQWLEYRKKAGLARRSGRRAAAEMQSFGRVVRNEKGWPERAADIAFPATLLHAALCHPESQRENGTAIVITADDIYRKRRKGKTGCHILFAVDTSSSMGAYRRMAVVKGAVMSLLQDSYEKRDRIGLLVFQNQGAELLMEFTNSAELAKRRLEQAPHGGLTPLAEGLRSSLEILKGAMAKEREMLPVFVLVTDGRATKGRTEDPLEEAMGEAERFAREEICCIVIDTEQGYVRLGLAGQLAEAMGGRSFSLEELREGQLSGVIRTVMQELPGQGRG